METYLIVQHTQKDHPYVKANNFFPHLNTISDAVGSTMRLWVLKQTNQGQPHVLLVGNVPTCVCKGSIHNKVTNFTLAINLLQLSFIQEWDETMIYFNFPLKSMFFQRETKINFLSASFSKPQCSPKNLETKGNDFTIFYP